MIALFHQNPVFDQQGGIERYLSTLANYGAQECLLVVGTEGASEILDSVISVRLRGPDFLPRWLRYVIGVIVIQGAIRRVLRKRGVRVIDFSRPELLILAPLFAGKKTVTLHGTGPGLSSRGKYLIHHMATMLIPLVAHRVHVVGRDPSAMKPWLRKFLELRTYYLDAWYDDAFVATEPPRTPPYNVFYAGRLAAQKNPDLLAAVITAAKTRYGSAVNFFFLGNEFAELQARGCGELVTDLGLKSARGMSEAIATFHSGILCSGFGEGSPFIIVETLACGRAFVVPPLATIRETYDGAPGVVISDAWTVDAFLAALGKAFEFMDSRDAHLGISEHVASRRASRAAPRLLESLAELGSHSR